MRGAREQYSPSIYSGTTHNKRTQHGVFVQSIILSERRWAHHTILMCVIIITCVIYRHGRAQQVYTQKHPLSHSRHKTQHTLTQRNALASERLSVSLVNTIIELARSQKAIPTPSPCFLLLLATSISSSLSRSPRQLLFRSRTERSPLPGPASRVTTASRLSAETPAPLHFRITSLNCQYVCVYVSICWSQKPNETFLDACIFFIT